MSSTTGFAKIVPRVSRVGGRLRVPGDKSISHRYAMLGAILQSTEGDVFIKITGPEGATLATKDQVKDMVKSAFAK